MLVLHANPGEKILIGDNVWLEVLEVRNKDGRVGLGFTAPREVVILRENLVRSMTREEMVREAADRR